MKTTKQQILTLLLGTLLPFLLMTIMLLSVLVMANTSYKTTVQNAHTVSGVSHDFKKNLDYEMYYYVIGRKKELPLNDVDNLKTILLQLEETTTLAENQWRIRSMINLCEKLTNVMEGISETEGYDNRMLLFELDIKSITSLIETYMGEYIYDEVTELSVIQTQINYTLQNVAVIIGIVTVVLVTMTLMYMWHFTARITDPIQQLCDKLRKVGKKDFELIPIKTDNIEMQTLDNGISDMISRINKLMERTKKNQDDLHRAELELLQAQINPHFLYNTLDSIIWLAETQRHQDVVKMVVNLSAFFRNSLNKGKDIITIEAEKTQVLSYLEIQKIRYGDILEYELDIPQSLYNYQLPKLVLQPLVENAIYHGVKTKRGKGKITVTGKEEDGRIILCVQDDGGGMDEEQLKNLQAGIYENRHTGLGLINVHKRIRLYCGKEYGLSFKSEIGKGTTVIVCLPKKNQLFS